MRRLSKVVNIVPVIAKADTLTLEERDYFKQKVRGVCDVWGSSGIFFCKNDIFDVYSTSPAFLPLLGKASIKHRHHVKHHSASPGLLT